MIYMHQFEDRCYNSMYLYVDIVSMYVYHGSNVLVSWCFIEPCSDEDGESSDEEGDEYDDMPLEIKEKYQVSGVKCHFSIIVTIYNDDAPISG